MYRIAITYIDGLTDLILTENRYKLTGVQTTELVTDNFYKLLNESEYKQQKVQNTNWNKYEIQIIANEDYNIELLLQARTITISGDEITHRAIVTGVDSTKTETDFKHVIIEYYDINLNNYKYGENPTVNFLRSDALSELYSFDELTVLRVVTDGSYKDFNSLFFYTTTATAAENANFTNTQDGSVITTNSVIKNQFELVFYLNGEDLQDFQTKVPLSRAGTSIETYLFTNSTGYNNTELIEISIEQLQGEDIYKATAIYIYENINHYQYN